MLTVPFGVDGCWGLGNCSKAGCWVWGMVIQPRLPQTESWQVELVPRPGARRTVSMSFSTPSGACGSFYKHRLLSQGDLIPRPLRVDGTEGLTSNEQSVCEMVSGASQEEAVEGVLASLALLGPRLGGSQWPYCKDAQATLERGPWPRNGGLPPNSPGRAPSIGPPAPMEPSVDAAPGPCLDCPPLRDPPAELLLQSCPS